MDENWFTLDANLLREALEITPIDQAHPFVSPPLGDAIIDFVDELGYPEVIHFMSSMVVNHLYQPWRAILSMINQYLTGKTSGHDRPRYPVLQMLWGIITSTNVDYAELIWKEFVQAMQTFLTDKANLGSPTKKGRKDKPHVIPYCRFTKLIIYHLGRIHNIHQRSASLFHLVEEDLRLGNLKFVSKGEIDEVFGMPIPNELISNNIKNASYYNAYLLMVAKHDQKVAAKKEGKKKSASTKQPKPKPAIEKSSKPALAPKPKVTKVKPSKASTTKLPKPKPSKEKSTKATPLQKASKGKVAKICNVKSSFQLVDEPDEEPAHSEPEGEEYDMERAIQMRLELFQAQGHAHVGALHTPKRRSTINQFILQRRTPTTKEASTGPSAQPLDDTSANIIRDSPSPANAETGARSDKTSSGGDTEIVQITEELGEDVEKQENVEEKTVELGQDQAGSDPGETLESRPQPEQVHMEEDQAGPDPGISRVALARPDPEPTHDEFITDVYPKNLEDVYAIGDQIINDKSTDDELGKINVEAEVVSMVIVPIYQASSSVPPLSTPVIDLSPPKPTSSTTQTPIFTATTTTTTPLPPPPFITTKHNRICVSCTCPPPPLPDSDPIKKRRHDSSASGSSQPPAPQSSAWKSTDTRDAPPSSSNLSDSEATTYQALAENSLLEKTGDMQTFMKWYCQKMGKTELTQVDLEDQIDWTNPEGDQVRIDISKPLPLSGPPGHVTIQTQFFFNKDLDYLGYGSKESRHVLSISKMKAARYLDFGLKLCVPMDTWINEVCTYDISDYYGISHRYDYLKEITLRIADYQEYTIAERDFKNLYPIDLKT
ncbi:hypothetical protein Tco_0570951 [Tanacetum coccineum]